MDEADRPFHEEPPRMELYLFVADAEGDYWFKTNHRFVERPSVSTVEALLDEARQHFAILYRGVDAADYSVELAYLDERRRSPSHSSSAKS